MKDISKINFNIILFIAVIASIFCVADNSWAATINAVSCSQADVQSAIESAKNGETVNVPACSNTTWNSGVTISGKGITLQGAGEGNTNIVNGMTAGSLVAIATDAAYVTRVTGFSFIDQHSVRLVNGGSYFMFMTISGSETNALFRVDHNSFTSNCNTDGASVLIMIDITGGAYGLLDNNHLNGGLELIHVQGSGDGSAAWSAADNPSTDRDVYIEDNNFRQNCPWNIGGTNYIGGTTIVQGYRGARYVVRHNQIYFMGIDAHGWAPSIPRRSTRWYEIYDNDFSTPDNANAFAFFQMRGGSGVIFGNSVFCGANSICGGVDLTDESYMFNPGTGCTNYPCQDQIGRGQGMNPDPLYIWNNTNLNASVSNGADAIIHENRDYFLSAKPGYSAYTYPHPLRYAGTGDLIPPIAPSGLTVK